ncbi:MAG: type II toxin-antitoxin system VapC family toxin [Pseudomonadota bacterium]|nr:type II toxin-antitoxin system VapC family toxin [Pseudomonadota bacterium]
MSEQAPSFNVVDSSGWIEFFTAGPNGPVFKPVIEDTDHLLVPTIALLEVHRILSRRLPPEVVGACLNVMRLARVLDLTDARAIFAAEISARHRLALADAAMYSAALEHRATFWTQDVDYAGLPGVRYHAKPGAAET